MIGRSLRSSTSASEKLRTFGRQWVCAEIHVAQSVGERGQVEEEVLRLAELGGRPVDPRTRVHEVGRVELVPAVVALVTARRLVAADRTGAFDVPVGQRVSGGGRERPERRPLDDEAVVVERAEQVLDDAVVVPRRRAREAVVRDPEIAEIVADARAVLVRGLTRRAPFLVRRDHHRRPMLVRPGHHEDVVAPQAVVAREDVRGYREPRHMPDVARRARIRPGRRDQDLLRGRGLGHGRS